MAHKEVIVALIMVIAASPLPAAQPDFSPIIPAGTATAPASFSVSPRGSTQPRCVSRDIGTRADWA